MSLPVKFWINMTDFKNITKDQFRNILDNTKIYMWTYDGELYSYLNKAWFDFTGQDKTVLLTVERWTEMVHPDDLDAAVKISEQYDCQIIYMTAHTDVNTIEKAQRTKHAGFLHKPFEPFQLKRVIEESLEQ